MENGRVVRGEYEGFPIIFEQRRRVICIKLESGRVAFIHRNVIAYKRSSDLSQNKRDVYIVKWANGKKSVISIPADWREAFISGCETGEELQKTSKTNTGASFGKRFLSGLCSFFIVAMVVMIICGALQDKSNGSIEHLANSDQTFIEPWGYWDGTSEGMPEAYVPVYVIEARGNGIGGGNIRGIARNRSTSKINYLQISFGLYSGETKVGTCFTNIADLSIGEDWQFNAYCSTWPRENPLYKIDDVNYW